MPAAAAAAAAGAPQSRLPHVPTVSLTNPAQLRASSMRRAGATPTRAAVVSNTAPPIAPRRCVPPVRKFSALEGRSDLDKSVGERLGKPDEVGGGGAACAGAVAFLVLLQATIDCTQV